MKAIFTGFGIGLVYKTLMSAFKLWKDTPEKIFGAPMKGGSISAEISPELLGVGYIIGPRISCIMMAGGVMSYLLLIPLIKFFGEGLPAAGKKFGKIRQIAAIGIERIVAGALFRREHVEEQIYEFGI